MELLHLWITLWLLFGSYFALHETSVKMYNAGRAKNIFQDWVGVRFKALGMFWCIVIFFPFFFLFKGYTELVDV